MSLRLAVQSWGRKGLHDTWRPSWGTRSEGGTRSRLRMLPRGDLACHGQTGPSPSCFTKRKLGALPTGWGDTSPVSQVTQFRAGWALRRKGEEKEEGWREERCAASPPAPPAASACFWQFFRRRAGQRGEMQELVVTVGQGRW